MLGRFMGINFTVSSDMVLTFNGLARTIPVRYAVHEVIGTKPKKEYLGPGLMQLKFKMELNATLGINPKKISAKLAQSANIGESSLFVLGGCNLGRYTINNISEAYGIITNNGKIVTISIDIDLEEYR